MRYRNKSTMPNDDEILALSTDIDNMLAAAQAFSQFAAEAQSLSMIRTAGALFSYRSVW